MIPLSSCVQSWLRVVDSYYALGQYSEAAAKTRQAVQECPGFKAMPEFKASGTP